MPNRIIKEKCRTSESLDRLSDGAERFFWRLVTVADDYGRFEANPSVLASMTFPLRNGRLKIATVAKWFEELCICKHVQAYTSRGKVYGYFVNWQDHQGSPRAKESKFPDPLQADASICEQMPANVPVSESVSVSDNRIRISNSDLAQPPVALLPPISKKSQTKKPLTGWPEGFQYTEKHKALAEGLGLNVAREFADFHDRAIAKNYTYADWDAAFRVWLRKAPEFKHVRAK